MITRQNKAFDQQGADKNHESMGMGQYSTYGRMMWWKPTMSKAQLIQLILCFVDSWTKQCPKPLLANGLVVLQAYDAYTLMAYILLDFREN